LLGKVFTDRDPPAVAVTPSEFEPPVGLFCPKAAAEGLTIVARSTDTGEMVGALRAVPNRNSFQITEVHQ
jgi:hypothetical protein